MGIKFGQQIQGIQLNETIRMKLMWSGICLEMECKYTCKQYQDCRKM